MISILLVLVAGLLATAKPSPADSVIVNPVLRLRLSSFSDYNTMPIEQPVARAAPPSPNTSGRNCFFTPVQCRLPINQLTSMDNPGGQRRPGFGSMSPFDRMRRDLFFTSS